METISLKYFVTPQSFVEDSTELACKVYDSDFRPTHLVALWRGGATVGITVQETLRYLGIDTNHIAVRTSGYKGMEVQREIRVYGLDYLVNTLNNENRLLVVDDVFDTGRSVKAFIETLHGKLRRNMPEQVKIATVYYKPEKNETDLTPDYFVHETKKDTWLVFPHELECVTEKELDIKGPKIALLLRQRKKQ